VKLRHGLASRREKTWERVVLAEVFRRQLFRIYGSKKVDDFILGYVQDLRARGFRTTADSFSDSILFEGPSRLDKRQRKTLKRFDKIAAESTAMQQQMSSRHDDNPWSVGKCGFTIEHRTLERDRLGLF
jgi:hypothetical protein